MSACTCWQICHKKKSFLLLLCVCSAEASVCIYRDFFGCMRHGCSCRLLWYWQTYIKCCATETRSWSTYRNERKFRVSPWEFCGADESFSAGRRAPHSMPPTAIGIESVGIYAAHLPLSVFLTQATHQKGLFLDRMKFSLTLWLNESFNLIWTLILLL